MSATIECEYCKKSFSTRGNLIKHQKHTKFCLELRGHAGKDVKYPCKYCGKLYAHHISRIKHQKICPVYKKTKADADAFVTKEELVGLRTLLRDTGEEVQQLHREKKRTKHKIKRLTKLYSASLEENDDLHALIGKKDREALEIKIELEKEIAKRDGSIETYEKMSEKMARMAAKPASISVTINPRLAQISITQIDPFTEEMVLKKLDEGAFNFGMYLLGISGFVEFIIGLIRLELDDGTIERNYACTDTSRYSCYRLLSSREWQRDNGAGYLKKILGLMKDLVHKYHWKIHYMALEEIESGKWDETHYQSIFFHRAIYHEHLDAQLELYKKIRSHICRSASVAPASCEPRLTYKPSVEIKDLEDLDEGEEIKIDLEIDLEIDLPDQK